MAQSHDGTDVLGLARRQVRLAPWTPRWAELLAHEAARLGAASGPLALRIEHYGTTSVPGLRAKPTPHLVHIVRNGGPDWVRGPVP